VAVWLSGPQPRCLGGGDGRAEIRGSGQEGPGWPQGWPRRANLFGEMTELHRTYRHHAPRRPPAVRAGVDLPNSRCAGVRGVRCPPAPRARRRRLHRRAHTAHTHTPPAQRVGADGQGDGGGCGAVPSLPRPDPPVSALSSFILALLPRILGFRPYGYRRPATRIERAMEPYHHRPAVPPLSRSCFTAGPGVAP
jgi:hypothetical protein